MMFVHYLLSPLRLSLAISFLVGWSGFCAAQQHSESELEFFETEVRPVLIERCAGCHGAAEQSGGLRVDLREALIKGGESGPAIIVGKPAESLMIKAVRHLEGLEMPPDEEPISERAQTSLQRWIEMGAPWPESTQPLSMSLTTGSSDHWAFQPVRKPPLPTPDRQMDWIRTPVDAFVLTELQKNDLAPSAQADRRSLIRRVTFSLTGLPPTVDDVEHFLQDDSPTAFATLVERLLASPEYGEHWARHWLDVARYSDTKGYVYAREERFWVHAWSFRDWVVAAFNENMPYDRFLLLQIAADQVSDRRHGDLAAMGFLTLGRRFLGVERDIIDDRIDVVCRGTMGLTVACARCHDHKYDPIPTADYYALYGVFDSSVERLEPLADHWDDEAFATELNKRNAALAERLAAARKESSDRVRSRIADYLFAQSELNKYPANGFDQIFQKEDILPAFVRRWERFLRDAERRADPIFSAWHAYAALNAESFADESAALTIKLQQDDLPAVVAQAFITPPTSFREVCDRYGKIFAEYDAEHKAVRGSDPQRDKQQTENAATELTNDHENDTSNSLLHVLYGLRAPCEVPEGPIVLCETYFDSGTVTELWKLQGEVDRWIINAPTPAPHALTLVDQPVANEPRIFLRGNPLTQGENVPRRFVSVLSQPESQPFQHGSGRYELAKAIVDPNNPLTARVIVNRIWTAHFGQGLVTTPSDFGTRAEPPSHPELLDWLAASLIESGWNLKELHRLIVMSATLQQSSWLMHRTEGVDSTVRANKIDPSNRLLWRMNARRLTFEEFRDSLLASAGELQTQVGGRASDIFSRPFPARRTLYGLVDRQFLPGTLRMFDFANPDLHVPQRSETTVPGQALFFLNHPLMLDRARALARSVDEETNAAERVTGMFRQALQREPTATEVREALAMVEEATAQEQPTERDTTADWHYGYGALDESSQRIQQFTPLPHFSGTAWQGGSSFPDATLGWVQLSADGGHPGNDREHAAVRRWIAPRNGTFRIMSKLQHEPAAGDGIRAFIAHSSKGILAAETIHQARREVNLAAFDVTAGETVDFVVDIGHELNSDQYLWSATIEEVRETEPTIWNSVADFPAQTTEQLDGWEQLAQIILCSNEFMFVD